MARLTTGGGASWSRGPKTLPPNGQCPRGFLFGLFGLHFVPAAESSIQRQWRHIWLPETSATTAILGAHL